MCKLRTLKLLSEENQRSLIDNFGHMATELIKNLEKIATNYLALDILKKLKNLLFPSIFTAQGLISLSEKP